MSGKPAASRKTDNEAPLRPLRAWLDRVHAIPLYDTRSPNRRSVIGVYAIAGQVAIVLENLDTSGYTLGWEIFVPTSSLDTASLGHKAGGSNDVAHALDAAALALGVEGCRGIV